MTKACNGKLLASLARTAMRWSETSEMWHKPVKRGPPMATKRPNDSTRFTVPATIMSLAAASAQLRLLMTHKREQQKADKTRGPGGAYCLRSLNSSTGA
jgi:hypothetical protein